jgi:protein arginine kinase
VSDVLFTKLVRRRNFAGFPFWISCAPETCEALAARARARAAAEGLDAGLHLADQAPAALAALREREILPERPVSFAGTRDFKRVFMGQPESGASTHALFGEVEHWTRAHLVAGLPDASVIHATRPPDFSAPGVFSHSKTYGWLTSNPAFAGTGLQIEAGLHLPALAAARRVAPVQKALAALGYELRPLSLRTPGTAESGHFRLLSRGGMDLPEETLYEEFAARTKSVLAAESGALAEWHQRETNLLEDRVHRAWRLLQEARRMEHGELLSLISFARIGVYLGVFPENSKELLEDLRVRAQPHQSGIDRPEAVPETGDAASETPEKRRADLARKLLAGIQPLG